MEDQNKQQSSSVNNKANEEKEFLKGAKILVRDQEGKFDYLEGSNLLEEKEEIIPSFRPVEKKEIKQVTASRVSPFLKEFKKPSEKLTADFYFDAEDEEEIQKLHDEKIGKAVAVIDYDSIIKQIAQESGVNFSEEFLKKRFSSLITSRLRDIRNSLQLKELLARSKKVGGLELPEEKINLVVKITEEKAKTIHDQDTIKELEERQKRKVEEEQKETEGQQKMRQAVAREQIKKAVQTLQQKKIEKIVTPPPPPPKILRRRPIPTIPQVRRPSEDITRRPKIIDIKTPQRLLGPVEEIRSLNLTDFRRLASSPEETIKKIKEKIELLEEESFSRKAEAIQAWKQSEINQLYLDIGNESMEKGKSVKEIIESRTMDGRSTLNEEEFRAVGDLNKKLRF